MNSCETWIRRWPAAVVVLLALALLALPAAQAAPKTYRIDLPLRSFTPDPDGLAYLQQRDRTDADMLLVQFTDHPDSPVKRSLGASGVHLQQYIGGGAWITYLEAGVTAAAFDGATVRWIGPVLPEDRIAPRVTAEQAPPWAIAGDDLLLSVQFIEQYAESDGELRLARYGDVTLGDYIPSLNVWYVQTTLATARRLATDNTVLAIDYIAPPMQSVNAGVRAALNVDELYDPPLELRGSGQTVVVYDGGIADTGHPDFENRGIVGENGGTSSHATHVMGTVGGNGGPAYRGMAPEATLVTYEYESCDPNCLYDSPQDIFENYQEALLTYGARIFTNSIGANIYANGYPCDWQGDYELTSALIDGIVAGDLGEPVIVGFAAGNERGGGPCGSTYETMTVPASAKNIITVGASDDNDNIASFSSWGPPDDGRIKPTITAPGVNVVSCAPGGGYQSMSGTSMATPAIAGVNALLTEAWGRYAISEFPMPATVKALLVNGAEDLYNEGPDYRYGWGRVDAARSVEMIETFGYLESQVGDDGVLNHSFNVPAGLSQLKVSIAWSDPPAAYLPPITLINDLDMLLIDPSGNEHQPWVLDWNNPGAPATTGVNVRDVVEQVAVDNPAAGSWTLRVTGTDVPQGPQNFSAAANVPLAEGVMTVAGQVTDANSGQPIEGAFVGLDGTGGGTETNADGNYFMYLPISEITAISAFAPGYNQRRAYILPTGEDEATIDFELTARPAGTASGRVFDAAGDPVAGVLVDVMELPGITTTTDANGFFSMQLPGGQAYRLHTVSDQLDGYGDIFVAPGQTRFVPITLATLPNKPTGPDPHGYIAVQSGDAHPMAPVFDWVEIDPDQGGPGTRIVTDAEEQVFQIALPFTFYYYGVSYEQITVNENGFFSMGNTARLGNETAADYSNSPLPDEDGPPALIGPFWEDFRANETNLSYWYDEANDRFIVEWYDSRQWPEAGTRETFQVILHNPSFDLDPAWVFPGRIDGRIVFQYLDVNDLGNATVGIESPNEEMGVQILYFNTDGEGSYAETAYPVTSGQAILFYRPVALAAGQVALSPPQPGVDIQVKGPFGAMEPQPDGRYVVPIRPGHNELRFSAPGYETFPRGAVGRDWMVSTLAPLTLSRLVPPANVTWEGDANEVTVSWSGLAGETDEFTGAYRVYKQGLMVAQTGQTSWVDAEPVNPPLYWVTAVYQGGESDSSAHATPGLTSAVGEGGLLPEEFEIGQAYPNPFNPATSVKVALPEAARVTAVVYDLLGREVVRLSSGERLNAGWHTLHWDARGQASGMYFVTVEAGPLSAVRKLVLLK